MSRNCSCNMNEYLKSTVERLKSQNYSALNIVLGNESCDLDSAVSALVYAAFLHWQHQKMQCRVCTRLKRTEEVKDEIFVPILNVEREDYEIKTEVAHCFREHGIDDAYLVFKDDFDFKSLISSSKSNVVLVDHHKLTSTDEHLTPHVKEIIDHRPLDKTHWGYSEDTRTTIELVGSCTTLVAQRIRDLSALFAKEVDFFVTNKDCTEMLFSTIILDTVNFSREVGKGTPHDEEVVLFLESILELGDYQQARVDALTSLVAARGDVSRLSSRQLLRKDAKMEGDILVPTLPILVREYLRRSDALSALESECERRKCTCAVLLGLTLASHRARDAAVYCTRDVTRNQLCAFLLAWQPSINLSEDTLAYQSDNQSTERSVRYFSQGNLSASRKQYMPALKAYLSIKS